MYGFQMERLIERAGVHLERKGGRMERVARVKWQAITSDADEKRIGKVFVGTGERKKAEKGCKK